MSVIPAHWDLYRKNGTKTGTCGVALLPDAVNLVQNGMRLDRQARYGQIQWGQFVYICRRRGRGFRWSAQTTPQDLNFPAGVVPWRG